MDHEKNVGMIRVNEWFANCPWFRNDLGPEDEAGCNCGVRPAGPAPSQRRRALIQQARPSINPGLQFNGSRQGCQREYIYYIYYINSL